MKNAPDADEWVTNYSSAANDFITAIESCTGPSQTSHIKLAHYVS